MRNTDLQRDSELQELEQRISATPARSGAGPYDVNPELSALALREAELLDAMGRGARRSGNAAGAS